MKNKQRVLVLGISAALLAVTIGYGFTKAQPPDNIQERNLASRFLVRNNSGNSEINADTGSIPLPKPRIKVEPMKWKGEDHISEGWDWSLPPAAKPHPYSGTTMPWPEVNGQRYDLPGKEFTKVGAKWLELEPEEGEYRFDILKKRIEEAVAGDWDGIELHIYASVWEIRDFPGHPVADYPPNWLEGSKLKNVSAPRWLAKYNIPTIDERPRLNLKTPFQITNLNIYHPDYHSRYLRFVRALGESGVLDHPSIIAAYQHTKSGSQGEEGMRPEEPEYQQRLRERIKAWADAFGANAYKLMYTSSDGDEVLYAYELGMGQRNGFVEQVVNHMPNPLLGQLVDENHYLVTDENLPPIAESRAFGDENEEYSSLMLPRFGPWETFMHRFRESTLRSLQMRRNFVWIESTKLDPDLTCYLSLSLGHNVETTTDAWCYLRESYPMKDGKPLQVKNFERWLYQRDKPGFQTIATEKVNVPGQMQNYAPGYFFDYTARQTDYATGNRAIGFALDDRFLSGGSHQVAIKVTYIDQGQAKWALVYNEGKSSREMTTWSHGNVRTVTWILNDIGFNARGMDFDFEIRTLEGDAIIKFVRVVKLDAGNTK